MYIYCYILHLYCLTEFILLKLLKTQVFIYVIKENKKQIIEINKCSQQMLSITLLGNLDDIYY